MTEEIQKRRPDAFLAKSLPSRPPQLLAQQLRVLDKPLMQTEPQQIDFEAADSTTDLLRKVIHGEFDMPLARTTADLRHGSHWRVLGGGTQRQNTRTMAHKLLRIMPAATPGRAAAPAAITQSAVHPSRPVTDSAAASRGNRQLFYLPAV